MVFGGILGTSWGQPWAPKGPWSPSIVSKQPWSPEWLQSTWDCNKYRTDPDGRWWAKLIPHHSGIFQSHAGRQEKLLRTESEILLNLLLILLISVHFNLTLENNIFLHVISYGEKSSSQSRRALFINGLSFLNWRYLRPTSGLTKTPNFQEEQWQEPWEATSRAQGHHEPNTCGRPRRGKAGAKPLSHMSMALSKDSWKL